MNAVATFLNEEEPANRWLVPQSALTQREDSRTIVVAQRGERLAYIDATIGESVGEWVAVESPELATGDAVLGQLASYIDEDNLLNVEDSLTFYLNFYLSTKAFTLIHLVSCFHVFPPWPLFNKRATRGNLVNPDKNIGMYKK